RAKRLQWPAGSDESIDGFGIVHKTRPQEHVEHIIEKCDRQERHAAISFAFQIAHQARGIGTEKGKSLELPPGGHIALMNPTCDRIVHNVQQEGMAGPTEGMSGSKPRAIACEAPG